MVFVRRAEMFWNGPGEKEEEEDGEGRFEG